jgi:hypothetical protein
MHRTAVYLSRKEESTGKTVRKQSHGGYEKALLVALVQCLHRLTLHHGQLSDKARDCLGSRRPDTRVLCVKHPLYF